MKRTNNRILAAGLFAALIVVFASVARGHVHIRQMARALYHRYRDQAIARAYAAEVPAERADAPMTIYDDKLAGGWQDWSWADRSLTETRPAHVWRGNDSIRMEAAAWKGLYLHHDAFGASGYGDLQFYLQGDADLTVAAVDSSGNYPVKVKLAGYCKPASNDGWKLARVPLADIGAPKGSTITGFVIQSDGAEDQGPIYIDSISLTPDMSIPPAPTSATIPVTVDLSVARHAISPYIYGMAYTPKDMMSELRIPLDRLGGNSTTRYNWVLGNATSAARDWNWANRKALDIPQNPGPSSAVDEFVKIDKSAGAQSLITVPTIGWVARDSNTDTRSANVPGDGGPGLDGAGGAIAGYDPTENRNRTCVVSKARKNGPFSDNPTGDIVYQDEWIHHLVKTFGPASDHGVKFYAMDNEPDIWQYTHTDIHPARMGYDDMLANFLEYSQAVKAVDPSALITGPVVSGWTGYLYSALDKGDDNYHTYADRKAHGDVPFLLWFLKSVRAHDARTGRRTLDVLDIHYYPQATGVFSPASDPDTDERRIRSVRSLWDPSYLDESWIADKVQLIPRMHQWIDEGYPGTKLGITEWNFGGEKSMSGGIAVADALGVFGREDLYLANYWAYPPEGSPVYLAFKLYRNADDNGHGFGDTSVKASTPDPSELSAYAAVDSATGATTVILINKMRKATVTAPITIGGQPQFPSGGAGGGPTHAVRAWRFSADAPDRIVALPKQMTTGNRVSMTLPPYSVTLVSITGGDR